MYKKLFLVYFLYSQTIEFYNKFNNDVILDIIIQGSIIKGDKWPEPVVVNLI